MLQRIIHWLAGSPNHHVASSAVVLPPRQVTIPAAQSTSMPSAIEMPPDISSLPRPQRLCMEQQIITRQYPRFRWRSSGHGVRIEGPILTTAGYSYDVRIRVSQGFPFAHPLTFIVSPIRGNGVSLTEVSHAMHTLSPDANNHPQLCLYNDSNWAPSLTLQHVLVKAAVWLEAFDQHCRTGRPISDFLANV